MSIKREERLIRKFLETPGTNLYARLPNLEERVAQVRADLKKANLEVYALRLAKPRESFIPNNHSFEIWKEARSCYGPRLIVRPKATATPSTSPKPFEKRFYNESSITYETSPGQGFEVYFRREAREVEILHVSEKGEFTYKANAHPDDQYDEQFGFELAAARLWEVYLGNIERLNDFLAFRQYVWGVKGWGLLDSVNVAEIYPVTVSTLLAASKDPSFRQRKALDGNQSSTETPFEILTRYKETTERGKEDRKTALQLWKDLKDAGYVPVDVRNAKTGDKFWWSCYCRKVLPLPEIVESWEDDPVLILEKTTKETPATAPVTAQEDRWIDEEAEDWHEGETAAQRAARVREFLKEKGLKVVDYRVPTPKDFHIGQDGAEKAIRSIVCGFTFGDKRLIVEPITLVPSEDDEKALHFIRQELREEGRDVSLAEGYLKQYREWGFEPVDYRPAKKGEFVDTVYHPTFPHVTEHPSRVKLLIFRKRS